MDTQFPLAAKENDRSSQPDEPPPLMGTWRRLYLAVLAWLTFLILIFYAFARRFTP